MARTGRPRKEFDEDRIYGLLSIGYSGIEIAEITGLSYPTIIRYDLARYHAATAAYKAGLEALRLKQAKEAGWL